MSVSTHLSLQRPALLDGRRPLWIFSPGLDFLVAWCWVPMFLVWHVLMSGRGPSADTFLREGVVVALAVSFLHQPLTFGLVYGDKRQVALHRPLFTWAPVVAVTVAVIAAVENLWIVVPVAAAWNLQHTLQQRYGLERIYAGKSGYGSARLDRALAYVPMTAVLFAVAAVPSTTGLVARSGLDPMNAGAVRLLVQIRPVATILLVAATIATGAVVALVVRQEVAAGSKANPAKWCYQLASLLLLGSIVIDPAAGFIAYVTAHAVEYGVVVYRTAERRYGHTTEVESFLDRVARSTAGRVAFFGGIVVAAWAARTFVHGDGFNALLYAVGALHFTYDAVIWKLRKPAVAETFAIPVRQPAPG
jgi:hypothetical protein